MAFSKFNPSSQTNPDTGLGVQATQIGGRFVNKDGSFNLRKTGYPLSKRSSVYSFLLNTGWLPFIGITLVFYIVANLIFTGVYLLIGPQQLVGLHASTAWGTVKEVFYFSTQTFTTVGYGRINPHGDGANILAAFETMCGWLFFALVTGLFYGRFTRPKAYIDFSFNALISPYLDGRALMFRMVPYKSRHYLTDAKVIVNLSLLVTEGGKEEYKFYQLPLERSRIDLFNMNWTVVHPINANSPLFNFTGADMQSADLELIVQVSGFDPVFSNIVMQSSSYTSKEIIWEAKFNPMYHESADGATTILELDRLNDFKKL